MSDTEARAARGERFERIWHDEGFEEVTQTWERQLTDALIDAKPGRETARLQDAIKMGRKFRDWVKSIIQDGKLARRDVEEVKSGRRPFF